MNKKLFFKKQLLSLLPYAAFMTAFVAIIAIFAGFSETPYNCYVSPYYDGYEYSYIHNYSSSTSASQIYSGTGLVGIGYAIVFFATLAPISVLSYRASLKEQEFYRQSPYPKNKLLLTRMLIMGGYIICATLIAFLVFFLVINMTINGGRYSWIYYEKADFVFWKVLLAFLMLCNAGIVQMVISCFFANYCNTLATMVFASFFGSLLLTLGFGSTSYYFLVFIRDHYFDLVSSSFPFEIYPSGVGIVRSFDILLQCNISKGTTSLFVFDKNYNPDLYIPISIINIILPILLATGAVIYLFFKNEPSAEFSGKAKPRSPIPDIVFHVTFAILFLYIQTAIGVNNLFSFPALLMMVASYYFLNCARRKTMKVDKTELYYMMFCCLVPIIFGTMFSLF